MNLKKNFAFNLFGAIIPLIIGILTIPIYINAVGLERYGVLSVVWIMLAYFVMFDLGVGKSTVYTLSHVKDDLCKSEVVGSALLIASLLSVISTVLLLLAFFNLSKYFFQASPKVFSEIQHSFYVVSALIPVALYQSVVNAIYESEDKFFNLNLLAMIGNSSVQIVPLIIAKLYTIDIYYLLLSILLCRVLLLLFSLLISRQLIDYSLVSINLSKASELMKFGGWLTISNFVSPIIVLSNRFSISGILGISMVPYFSVPYQLCEKLNLIPSSLSRALFPKLTAMKREQQLELMLSNLKSLILVTTPLCLVGIFIVDGFISAWIGTEFAKKTFLISQLILITIWLNGLSFLPYTYLMSSGKTKFISYTHLFELFPYLGLLYFLVKNFGLLGAAVAGLVRVIVDFILLSYFTGIILKVMRVAFMYLVMISLSFVIYASKLGIAYDYFFLFSIILFILILNKKYYISNTKLIIGKLKFPS